MTPKDESTTLSNVLSINVRITDACETATVTKPEIADLTWAMAAATKKTEVARWDTNPSDCKARMLYTWTVPAAILDKVATTTDGSGDGGKIELTLDGENASEGVVAEHTVKLQIKGPAGTDIANGFVEFKVTVGAKVVAVGEGEVNVPAPTPGQGQTSKQGPSAKATVEGIAQVINVAGAAFVASGAKPPAPRSTGGTKPGAPRKGTTG